MKGIDVRWVAVATLFILFDAPLIAIFEAGSDWSPLWTAGRLTWEDASRLYDFDLIADLQGAHFDEVGFHPYIYPPSALLLIGPLALLPFWPSYVLVAIASLGALAWACRKAGSEPLLVLLAPPVVIAAIVGQTSPLIIGLVVLAFSTLEKHEAKAGALLAAAALIKPTLLVLAPVGLVAGRHWRALGAAVVAGGTAIALSLLLFGIQPWLDWLQAIPRFQQAVGDFPPLVRNLVSPHATAVRLGLESKAVIIVGAILATTFAWLAFSRPTGPATRSAIIMGGALLLTPYAMQYELAVFAPALLALPRDRLFSVAVVAVWSVTLFLNAGIVGLAIAYAATAYPTLGLKRSKIGSQTLASAR